MMGGLSNRVVYGTVYFSELEIFEALHLEFEFPVPYFTTAFYGIVGLLRSVFYAFCNSLLLSR